MPQASAVPRGGPEVERFYRTVWYPKPANMSARDYLQDLYDKANATGLGSVVSDLLTRNNARVENGQVTIPTTWGDRWWLPLVVGGGATAAGVAAGGTLAGMGGTAAVGGAGSATAAPAAAATTGPATAGGMGIGPAVAGESALGAGGATAGAAGAAGGGWLTPALGAGLGVANTVMQHRAADSQNAAMNAMLQPFLNYQKYQIAMSDPQAASYLGIPVPQGAVPLRSSMLNAAYSMMPIFARQPQMPTVAPAGPTPATGIDLTGTPSRRRGRY